MNDGYINKGNEIQIVESQDLTQTPQLVNTRKDFAKYWEKDYINQKLNMIQNSKHQMLFRLLWMSGIRISEATHLKKQDIDFQNYTMVVRWQKSKKWKNRVVPIHPTLQQVLQVYTGGLKSDDLLFGFSRQRAWQLARKHFNGHPHQFRHSFAVHWLRSDGDIIILHRILGHSKIQTTMEYLNIVPVDQGKELIKIQF